MKRMLVLAFSGCLLVGCMPKRIPEDPSRNPMLQGGKPPVPAGEAGKPEEGGAKKDDPQLAEPDAEDPPAPGTDQAAKPDAADLEGFTTTASGLKYKDLTAGTGKSPNFGETAVVHYTGTLEDGTKFDSSLDRGEPFEFRVGMGEVIPAWDEGVKSMKVGGKRQLICPPDLAYGPGGHPPDIPPNATLHFDVELLDVK